MKKYYFSLIIFFSTSIFSSTIDTLKIENTKVKIDSIKITGNVITEEFIIRREMTISSGDSVNQQVIHFNRERIFSLRLFNRVELFVIREEAKNILQIEVVESWYIYPLPFFRVQNNSIKTLTAGINFTIKNFRGRNETLKAILGFGYDSFISLYYDNPALIYSKDIGLNFGFTYIKYANRNYTAERINGSAFYYKVVNTSLGFYKRLNQFNLVGASLSYEYWETQSLLKPLITSSGSLVDRMPAATAYYYYDSRDLKQYSQNGLFGFFGITQKGFGLNNLSYNILEIDFREYRTIYKELTGKWRVNYRHTFGNNIPYYDYSFFGYSEKIRGHFTGHEEGQNSFLTSLELNYPLLEEWNVSFKLPLLPQSLTSARIAVYINAFVDGGMAYNNEEALALNKFISGFGFGITILALPYNAFRMEFAINELGQGEFVFASGFSF
jgi:outer membrane protein assembly factor BamA